EQVAIGRVRAPGFFEDPLVRKAYCGTRWTGDGQGQLNPTQETEAAIARADAGLSTYAEETASISGGDWEANIRRRRKEEQARQDAGLPSQLDQQEDD
ncbi:MAG: phage portal protein, partial [Thiohalospira sp.]